MRKAVFFSLAAGLTVILIVVLFRREHPMAFMATEEIRGELLEHVPLGSTTGDVVQLVETAYPDRYTVSTYPVTNGHVIEVWFDEFGWNPLQLFSVGTAVYGMWQFSSNGVLENLDVVKTEGP